jgi:hypothetical protein
LATVGGLTGTINGPTPLPGNVVTNQAAIASLPISASLPVPYALYTAESYAGSNYGPVTTIPDISGNGRSFINVSGVTNIPTGIGGHPAFWSVGSGYVTNWNLFAAAPQADTNCTFTLVFVNSGSGGTFMASGQSDDNLQFYGNGVTQVRPVLAMGRLQNESDFAWSSPSNVVHVLSFGRNQTNFYLIDNERCYVGGPVMSDYQNSLPTCTNIGINSGNLFLWNCTQHSRPESGLIAVLRIDYPALTLAQMEAVSRQYDQYYNQQGGDITMIGESQMYGNGGSLCNPAYVLSRYIGSQYNIENVASGGLSSSDSTNQMRLQGLYKPGPQIDVWHQGTLNGTDAGNFAILTNNTLTAASIAHASGHLFVVCTPLDIWQDAQANWTEITNYTYWVTNTWQTWADGVVNIANDPLIGVSNSWLNLTWHVNDGLGHLNDAGIYYWVTNYIGPVVKSLTSPGNYSISQTGTNAPNTPIAIYPNAVGAPFVYSPVTVTASNSWTANLFTATNTMPNFGYATIFSNAASGPGALWIYWRSNAQFYPLGHFP